MEATAIDHVNLRYPEDELETALGFYCEKLGFKSELVGEEDGVPTIEHPSHFSIRTGETCLFHMTPASDPQIVNRYRDANRTGFDHVSLLFDEPIGEIEARLDEAGIEIRRRFEPAGATGTAPAVFVVDPFGYVLELKEDPRRERSDTG